MAEDKKSVLLYVDTIHTVEKLSDKDAGLLFKHLLRYVNDKDPEAPSPLIDIVFEPIKQTLKRDLKKYEQRREQNRRNAKKRWEGKDATASDGNETDAKDADKGKGIGKDIVIVKGKDINIRKQDFIQNLASSDMMKYLNEKKYDLKEVDKFISYWTEHNEGGKKMRFEMAKNQPFNIKRRLGTWFKNNKDGFEKTNASGSNQSRQGTGSRKDFA